MEDKQILNIVDKLNNSIICGILTILSYSMYGSGDYYGLNVVILLLITIMCLLIFVYSILKTSIIIDRLNKMERENV